MSIAKAMMTTPNTGGIVGRDDGQGDAPLSHARDDTAMRDPPTVALATTPHNTTREVKGGRATNERGDGQTEMIERRACVHAHARCS